MEDLGAAAFWMFVAAIVFASFWKKKSARHEAHATIRLAIERGQPLDPLVVDQLLHDKEDDNGLLVVGAILLAMGVAFPVMGYFFSVGGERDAFYPLTGVGALLFMMGVAFVAVWAFVRRSRSAAKPDRSDA